jgi:hypothetical protein
LLECNANYNPAFPTITTRTSLRVWPSKARLRQHGGGRASSQGDRTDKSCWGHSPAGLPSVDEEGEAGEPGGSCMRNSGEVWRSQARELGGGNLGGGSAAAAAAGASAAAAGAAGAAGARALRKSSGVAWGWAAAGADWNSAPREARGGTSPRSWCGSSCGCRRRQLGQPHAEYAGLGSQQAHAMLCPTQDAGGGSACVPSPARQGRPVPTAPQLASLPSPVLARGKKRKHGGL